MPDNRPEIETIEKIPLWLDSWHKHSESIYDAIESLARSLEELDSEDAAIRMNRIQHMLHAHIKRTKALAVHRGGTDALEVSLSERLDVAKQAKQRLVEAVREKRPNSKPTNIDIARHVFISYVHGVLSELQSWMDSANLLLSNLPVPFNFAVELLQDCANEIAAMRVRGEEETHA